MRRLILPMLVTLSMVACGGVDDPPLGGPYGGTTDTTGPNGGQPGDPNSNTNNTNNNNTNTGSDAGSTTTTQKDSGSTTTTTKDSGTTQTQQQDSGSTQQQNNAPTWTQIFNDYLAGSTKGRCSSCHSQGSSKGNLYSWLQGKGYINGTSSALVDSNQSCLVWYGGNMPTSGVSSWPQAVTDMNAWAAAGALNN